MLRLHCHPPQPSSSDLSLSLGSGPPGHLGVQIEGYEARVQVLSDGCINLPRLGTVDVWGLTLEEARQRITDGYSRFLRRPLVYHDLVEQRPVRITVTGRVCVQVFTLPVNGSSSAGAQEISLESAPMVAVGQP